MIPLWLLVVLAIGFGMAAFVVGLTMYLGHWPWRRPPSPYEVRVFRSDR